MRLRINNVLAMKLNKLFIYLLKKHSKKIARLFFPIFKITEKYIFSRFVEVCEEESLYQTEGVFVWPITSVGVKAVLPCPRNPKSTASRWVGNHRR